MPDKVGNLPNHHSNLHTRLPTRNMHLKGTFPSLAHSMSLHQVDLHGQKREKKMQHPYDQTVGPVQEVKFLVHLISPIFLNQNIKKMVKLMEHIEKPVVIHTRTQSVRCRSSGAILSVQILLMHLMCIILRNCQQQIFKKMEQNPRLTIW